MLFLMGITWVLVRGVLDRGMGGAEVSEVCCSSESDECFFLFLTDLTCTLLSREFATGEAEGVMW